MTAANTSSAATAVMSDGGMLFDAARLPNGVLTPALPGTTVLPAILTGSGVALWLAFWTAASALTSA
jgi:hypothetical protein